MTAGELKRGVSIQLVGRRHRKMGAPLMHRSCAARGELHRAGRNLLKVLPLAAVILLAAPLRRAWQMRTQTPRPSRLQPLQRQHCFPANYAVVGAKTGSLSNTVYPRTASVGGSPPLGQRLVSENKVMHEIITRQLG